jgi:hypothetical protein
MAHIANLTEDMIAEDLCYTTSPLIKALFKLYLFPDSAEEDKWSDEVYDALHETDYTRRTGKLMNKQFILNSTINKNRKLTEIWYNNMSRIYSSQYQMRTDATYDRALSIAYAYYDWLATTLSKRGEIIPQDVYEELERLDI